MNMRSLLLIVATVLLCVVSALSASNESSYVIPIKNDIAIFAHNPMITDEKPIFIAGTSDRLLVTEASGTMLKVADLKGNSGWVGKDLVRPLVPDKSMAFNDINVYAYLDNPQPILILDGDDPNAVRITLDRSFATELRENLDRYTVNRIVGGSEAMW
jgi:hypothetical protein